SPSGSFDSGKLKRPVSSVTTEIEIGDPSLCAVTTTPSIRSSSSEMTRPVSATPDCARRGDEECDPAYTTSAVTPMAAVSNRLVRMTASGVPRLLMLLLLFQKREGMTDTLVCVGSRDVVRIASNDDEPRVRNLYLVGSRFLHRMHLGAVRGD